MAVTQVNLRPILVFATLFAVFSALLAFNPYKQSVTPRKPKNTTRILTWWGYFDDREKMSEIGRQCDTRLQIKEYLNTTDLLHYAARAPYDIYIYPWGFQKKLNQHFKQQGAKINQVVVHYHSAIKDKYYQYNIPQDTVHFQHFVNLFVYDKNYISDLNDLNATDILQMTRTDAGTVFIPDFLTQIDWLIKQVQSDTSEALWRAFYYQVKARQHRNHANHSGLRISSFITDYFKPDANPILGWLDSGEAMNPHFDWSTIKDPSGHLKALRLGIHPSLSNIGSDVLALKSYYSRDQCVAQAFSSRAFLQWVAQTSFYFSPFKETGANLPEPLQQLTQEFYNNADKLPWLYDLITDNPPSPEAERIWRALVACHNSAKPCDQWITLND